MGRQRPKAIGDFVIVQLREEESSRIVIPDIAKNKVTAGAVFRVIDRGDGCRYIKNGDQIIISTPSSSEFDFDGQHYFVIPERNIAVVIR